LVFGRKRVGQGIHGENAICKSFQPEILKKKFRDESLYRDYIGGYGLGAAFYTAAREEELILWGRRTCWAS